MHAWRIILATLSGVYISGCSKNKKKLYNTVLPFINQYNNWSALDLCLQQNSSVMSSAPSPACGVFVAPYQRQI